MGAGGAVWMFFLLSILSLLLSPSLVDGLVKAEILFQRVVTPKTTNEKSHPQEKCG